MATTASGQKINLPKDLRSEIISFFSFIFLYLSLMAGAREMQNKNSTFIADIWKWWTVTKKLKSEQSSFQRKCTFFGNISHSSKIPMLDKNTDAFSVFVCLLGP